VKPKYQAMRVGRIFIEVCDQPIRPPIGWMICLAARAGIGSEPRECLLGNSDLRSPALCLSICDDAVGDLTNKVTLTLLTSCGMHAGSNLPRHAASVHRYPCAGQCRG
jgi:hypothetical protein